MIKGLDILKDIRKGWCTENDLQIVEKELIVLNLIIDKIGIHRFIEEFDFTFTKEEYLLIKEVFKESR